MAKKIWIGSALLLVILTTSFYMLMPGKVRIDFQETRTIFRVWEEDKFVISGIEYTRIFDGTALMRAKNRSISYDIKDNTTEWYRIANFKDGIIVEDFIEFENEATDVEDVPVNHKICFTNANGKIFEYLVSDITYDGETKDITSPFSFGKKMKVTFQDGYYRAKVYQNKVADDKIIVRYKVTNDYECFDVRLFDPVRYYMHKIYISATTLTVSDFSINDCVVENIESGLWNLSCSGADYETQRAKVMKTLFYGTDGTDPRVILITGLTALVTVDSKDIGKRAFYSSIVNAETGGIGKTAVTTITFNDTTDNTNCSSWSYVALGYRAPTPSYYGEVKWALPTGTTLNRVTTTPYTIDETGMDKSADEKNNPATGYLYTNNFYVGANIGKVFGLYYGNISFVNTDGTGGEAVFVNTDFYNNYSIPYFTSLTMGGTVKDSNNLVVNNAIVIIVDQSDNTIYGTTTSNSTGGWVYTSEPGTYLVVAYDPNNSTISGDVYPHIVVS